MLEFILSYLGRWKFISPCSCFIVLEGNWACADLSPCFNKMALDYLSCRFLFAVCSNCDWAEDIWLVLLPSLWKLLFLWLARVLPYPLKTNFLSLICYYELCIFDIEPRSTSDFESPSNMSWKLFILFSVEERILLFSWLLAWLFD